MGVSFRRALLGAVARVWILAAVAFLCGCGLIVDAVQWIQPIATDEVQRICLRKRVQVGISVEPFRPFVFPAVFTDEGVRITGMDVELIRALVGALRKECGGDAIEPVVHLVRFRDLFVMLNEGKLDFFVSSISANVPLPARSGFAYSSPYFTEGGLGGLTHRREIAQRIAATVGRTAVGADLAPVRKAFAGLTVAVQEGTTAELYARGTLKDSRLLLCDSLPAAFEWQAPPIDVMLGKLPVLQYERATVRKDWEVLATETGTPLRLTREQYAVAMAEDSYRLRALVNHELFLLDETGRLAEMRRRWFEDSYAYPRRAATEGLPFAAENVPAHYDQGTCRLGSGR